MKIKLMPRVEDISPEDIGGSNVIVIDMLRATSVITEALSNGACRVIPVVTVDEAFEMRKKYGSDAVLCGERRGIRIEGFDSGNSPSEYSRDFVKGKTLIMTTSNGTRAINACRGARNILIGSMLNGKAAARRAAGDGIDISIACAGTLGNFSLDDFICAGYIIDEIMKVNTYELNDISFLAHHIFLDNRESISGFLRNASHYNYLLSIGAENDLKYCCKMGIIDIVPLYKDGIIINPVGI